MRKIYLIACVLLTCFTTTKAQSGSVYGNVLDNSTNQAGVPNYTVYLYGTMHDSVNNTYINVNDSVVTDNTGAFTFFVATYTSDIDSAYLTLSIINCNNTEDTIVIDLNSNYFAPFLFFACENIIPTCSTTMAWQSNTSNIATIDFSSADFVSGNNWQIDFGDGSAVGSQATTHTYSALSLQSGVTATLTITFSNNCVATEQIFIQVDVSASCAASFSYTEVPVLPPSQTYVYSFMDASTGNTISWLWHFGDGDSSNVQNPTHIYQQAGNYTVCLSITTNAGCINTYCNFLNIIDTANVNCTSNFTYMLAGGSVADYVFDGTQDSVALGTYSGNWNFGDSTTAFSTLYPTHTFAYSGTYNVCFTATYTNGCSHTSCETITVLPTTLYATTNVEEPTLYPNPAKKLLYINFTKNINAITIIDLLGNRKIIVNENGSKNVLDISGIASGIYCIFIYDEAGNMWKNKFIKQ